MSFVAVKYFSLREQFEEVFVYGGRSLLAVKEFKLIKEERLEISLVKEVMDESINKGKQCLLVLIITDKEVFNTLCQRYGAQKGGKLSKNWGRIIFY